MTLSPEKQKIVNILIENDRRKGLELSIINGMSESLDHFASRLSWLDGFAAICKRNPDPMDNYTFEKLQQVRDDINKAYLAYEKLEEMVLRRTK